MPPSRRPRPRVYVFGGGINEQVEPLLPAQTPSSYAGPEAKLVIRVSASVRSSLARVVCAMAVFFLAFAPTMDALAKEDALESSPTIAERVLASFDVLDDLLDHLPGKPPPAAQHHVQLAAASITAASDAGPITVRAVIWPKPARPTLASVQLPLPDHPPRS